MRTAPALLALATLSLSATAEAFQPPVEFPLPDPSLRSVAIDGERFAVATPGTVQVYSYFTLPWFTGWFPYTLAPGPSVPANIYGTRVDLSGDRLAVLESLTSTPVVHIYELSSTTYQWEEVAAFSPPQGTLRSESYGSDLEIEGDLMVVANSDTAGERGEIYVYRRGTDGVWAYVQTVSSPITSNGLEFFGKDIALANGRLAVGAPGGALGAAQTPGRVYVYSANPVGQLSLEDTFSEPGNDVAGNGFGRKVAFDGTYLVVRSDLRHYTYRRNVVFYWWSPVPWPSWTGPTHWDVSFAGAMRADSGRVIVGTGGAYGLDAAFVYDITAALPAFEELVFLNPAVPGLGTRVAISGGRALVGAGGFGVTGRLFLLEP